MDDLSLEAIGCTKPDAGVMSSSDRKAVIVFLTLSQDELDRRVQRWISADTWELCRVGLTTHLRPGPFERCRCRAYRIWSARVPMSVVDGRLRV